MNGEVSRTLVDLSEKLTAEVDLLTQFREAVSLERQELEHLHKIDIAATALDQLLQDYGREQARLETEVETLERAIEEAKRQVQDIALKAIEGASGSRALAHVNQIAMEQAKGLPQG